MSSSNMENELRKLQEKYEMLQHDHAIAVLHNISALEELEEYKVKLEDYKGKLETVSEELINVSIQLETVNEKMKDLFDDISKVQEVAAKEMELSRENCEKAEVEAKKDATTHELISLEVGAQNRTTIIDIYETDAPLNQVPPAKVEDETNSDDESAIIAFSHKLKRARFC